MGRALLGELELGRQAAEDQRSDEPPHWFLRCQTCGQQVGREEEEGEVTHTLMRQF
jgi:hypothetical protein